LLSISPAFVQSEVQKGSRTGKLLQGFKENVDRPLAAILTLNTVAHTVGAIGVGAQATKIWPDSPMSTMVVPVVMTLVILILSEIIPKTIGANNWQSLAGFTSVSLDWIIKLLFPLVWVSQLITKKLKKDKNKSVLSRSDFTAMSQIAKDTGVFQPGESRIMENLMKFNSIQAKDVMTPRTVIKASKADETINAFYEKNSNLRFSRVPIFTDTKDAISHYFLKDDLLKAMIDKKGQEAVSTIKREITIVNENINILKLFDQLMEKREHIALVVDEFGGTAGLVTMEDIIETLLGMEIVDEFDNIEDMQSLARKKWQERAEKLGLLEGESGKA